MTEGVYFRPVEFYTCDEEQSYVDDVVHWHDGVVKEEGYEGERDKAADEIVSTVVDATFMSHFGVTPADRFQDFFEQMAFFADHLSSDHPFSDGNKRTTVKQVIAYMYSCGIGIRMKDSDDPEKNELYRLITDLVKHKITFEEVGRFLRSRAFDLKGN